MEFKLQENIPTILRILNKSCPIIFFTDCIYLQTLTLPSILIKINYLLMKIIFCSILFLFSVFIVVAGGSDDASSNSLITTYYNNAKKLLTSNPNDCIFWADKVITESKKDENKYDLCRSLFIKGIALEHLHQNKASVKFFHQSLKVARDFKFVNLETEALDKLSTLYAKSGDYKSAILYATLLHEKKDSNAVLQQRVLAKSLPGKVDLNKREIKLKQLLADNSALDDNLRSNLKMIDNQGEWILIIVIGYGLIFLSFIMIKRQNRIILLKNRTLTDQMHTLEVGKMELEHARYKAEESERLKTSFLANISHEIKTPLNAIVGFSGFLRQKEKSVTERKKYIDIIHQYSESLLSLITEIFEVARIESGEIKQDHEVINVNEFLKKIQAQYFSENNQAIQNGLSLVLNLQSNNTELYLKTYPERLRSVLLHLIENALKYSETAKVEFGYVIKEPFIEFYVMDDGIGIPKEKMGNMFERFDTKEGYAKMNSGPLGLGLTLSRNFVESLGGHIWAKNNNGQGATFFFTLPLHLDIKQ